MIIRTELLHESLTSYNGMDQLSPLAKPTTLNEVIFIFLNIPTIFHGTLP